MGGWPQLQDFSSIILALPYCSQVTLAFLLQLMKISDSSCFNQPISLWLLQFLWITLLLVTYMNLDTCSALSLLSTYPTLDTSLAWICHIHLCSASFMPCLSVFYFLLGGLLHPLPEETITNNGFPLFSFSQIPVVTPFIKSTEFKIFHCENIDKGGEWGICFPGLHNKWPQTERFSKKQMSSLTILEARCPKPRSQ